MADRQRSKKRSLPLAPSAVPQAQPNPRNPILGATSSARPPTASPPRSRPAPPAGLTHAWTWAALMRRVFALDVLACPRCGGRLRVIATVQDPAVVRAILAHLGLATGSDSPSPAPPQPDHTAATG